jgi:LPXTG-site transpeptidase (sortase) family protein
MNFLSREPRGISPTRTHILGGACYFFLTLGALALGYAGFVFADSHVYQALEMKKFEQAGLLSEPHILVEGEAIGEVHVPRLGLNAIVVQGDSPANLRRAVGHISKSALPGKWGNVALAGHRDTFFRPLRNIRVGDEIDFTTPERSLEYIVESVQVVAPNDVQVLEPSTGHDLTLVTCFPFYFVGPAPKRFVVRAREVDGTLREQLAKK